MDNRVEAPQLRSLRIGEIFDRATTMYVQNFTVFTLIVLTLLAPTAILRFLLLGEQTSDFSQLLDEIQHPGHAQAHPSTNASLLFATFGIALISLLLAPYVNNAVASGVAMLYNGERPKYALAFRRVFARGAQLLVTLLLCVLMLIAIYVVISITLILASALTFAVFGMRGQTGIAIILVGALILIAAIVLIALVCVFALYATTLEGQTATHAIAQAFSRLFNRHEFRKALLLTLAYVALELIALIVTGTISVLLKSVTHSTALELTFSTIAGAMLNAYITILLAVYYFDVRTRVEGLDLEVDIARLSSAE